MGYGYSQSLIKIKPTNYVYVGKNGNDSSGDGSANKPYLTIQKAITASSSGVAIWIFPGTYTESITFKAGVYLTSPELYSVYIVGNHIADFSGTAICENINFQNAVSVSPGTVLTFSGTGTQNLQFYHCTIDSRTTSGNGDAINWTNTSSSSKIQIIDSSVSVASASSSSRCFYSTTGAAGSVIADRTTFKLASANADLVCLGIGGAITFTHTADVITGQIVVANTAAARFTSILMTTLATPVLTTTSTGTTVVANCIAYTGSTTYAFDGTGVFAFSAIIYGSTGIGGNPTLNSGVGVSPLAMAPLRIRASTLLPAAAVAAGLLDGTVEYNGTHFYGTIGTTRSVII